MSDIQPAMPTNDLDDGSIKCPHCGGTRNEPVGFTWWGGFVGPKILHAVRCLKCFKDYNGETGKPLAIVAYMAIVFGVVLLFTILGIVAFAMH